LLIDSHAHLEMNAFEKDRTAILYRAKEAGVRRILTVGTNKELSKKARSIAETTEGVMSSVGIHPHDAAEADADGLAVMERLAASSKVAAFGEIGLDFFKNYSPRDVQIRAFESQLDLAHRLALPLILHVRDAHNEAIEILQRSALPDPPGVFHCFSGNMDHAMKALDMGFSLSFPGTITFSKNMAIHQVMQIAPPDKMLFETDCPYLTPAPFRGKRNEPSYVRFVYEKAAEVLKTDIQTLEQNAKTAFVSAFALNPESMYVPVFAYPYKGNLYFNLTNQCTNDCDFCVGRPIPHLGDIDLALPYKPSFEQVMRQAGPDLSGYEEVVFCGVGEPTLRLEVLKRIAAESKKRGAKKVRLDTNGHANLIWKRSTSAEIAQWVDEVRVSLNAPDAKTYAALCRPKNGEAAFDAVVGFIGDAKNHFKKTSASAVAVPGLDVHSVENLARSLGVELIVRKHHPRKNA